MTEFIDAWLQELGLAWSDIRSISCWYAVVRDDEQEARRGNETRQVTQRGPQRLTLTTWDGKIFFKERKSEGC